MVAEACEFAKSRALVFQMTLVHDFTVRYKRGNDTAATRSEEKIK